MRGLSGQELSFLSMCGHGRTPSRLFTPDEEEICDRLFERGLIEGCNCPKADHSHAVLTVRALLAIECQALSEGSVT